jgi:hypothetical protein
VDGTERYLVLALIEAVEDIEDQALLVVLRDKGIIASKQ